MCCISVASLTRRIALKPTNLVMLPRDATWRKERGGLPWSGCEFDNVEWLASIGLDRLTRLELSLATGNTRLDFHTKDHLKHILKDKVIDQPPNYQSSLEAFLDLPEVAWPTEE